MKILKVSLILSIGILISCQGYYDYNNQEGWSGDCTKGQQQSPVNIDTLKVQGCQTGFNFQLKSTNQKYRSVPWTKENKDLKNPFNGTTIIIRRRTPTNYQVNYYNAIQYHFHFRAEHWIDYQNYPLELHIVHQGWSSLAVYALFFKVKPGNFNDVFDTWGIDSQTPSDILFPFALTTPPSVYHYKGSLTTPGCAEGVLWFVNPQPILVTARTMAKLQAAINGGKQNNRKVQPLNSNRAIYQSGSVCNAGVSHFSATNRIHRLSAQ